MWRAVLCLATVLAAGVEYVQKVIDSPLEDIQWVTEKVIFVLSEGGQLYRSEDGGRSWKTQNSRLGEDAKVSAIDISPANKDFIFFRGSGGKNYATRDMGKTYSASTLDMHDCRLHPTQPEWLLASAMSKGCTLDPHKDSVPCFKQLFYSKDFGKSWSHAVDYVVQFDWSPTWGLLNAAGERQSDHLAFATIQSLKVGDQKFGAWDKNIHFVQSSNFFNSVEVVVQHGNRFLFGEHNYLFVAAVNPDNEEEVTLEVSRDNSTLRFFSASLPVDLTEHSYTILDTSEGSVFLHVNHRPFGESAKTGHVYISDWSGLRYSLSLPYNRRSAEGKCDFDKVEGMEGVYIANFVDVEDKFKDGEEAEEKAEKRGRITGGARREAAMKTKTVITYDKGAEWSYLKAPKVGADGKAILCKGECHLHLHGLTDVYGPFYSTKTAVGLIMGTGTVGRYLRQTTAVNTYLSRDAGVSWREVAKGSHIYEFGDHGGLVVMAKDAVETNSILYSWNEGATWTELVVSEEAFQVENIIIEPTSAAEQFVVYGWRDDVGVLIYVDFAELHEATCKGFDAPDTSASDYETWTPSDGKANKCVMGHTVTYTRRKADSQCFNPEEFERPLFKEHCVCTRSDFECDFGYETKSIEGGPCVKAAMSPKHVDPESQGVCRDFSRVTKGYRRVPGDTCLGGAEWEAELVPCPSVWISNAHSGSLVMFILCVIAATLLLVALASKHNLAQKWAHIIKDKFSEARYRIVGGNVPVSVADDEGFYLNEDEFSQSAQPIKDEEGGRTKYSALPHSRIGHGGSVPVLPGPADTLDEL